MPLDPRAGTLVADMDTGELWYSPDAWHSPKDGLRERRELWRRVDAAGRAALVAAHGPDVLACWPGEHVKLGEGIRA